MESITLIDTRQPHTWRVTMGLTGIGALLILIADVYAIVMIVQSAARDIEKLLWVLLVLILPVIGVIVWYVAGPGRKPF
jgi:cytochrome bd-type quinol oxidase subunit 1